MARRRATVSTGSGRDIVVLNQPAPAPIRRRSSGGIRRRSRRRGRRRSRVGYDGGYKGRLIGTAIGGLAYGFLEKTFPDIPRVPIIGKSGTVALACFMLGGKHPIIKDIGVAAAAIAGYSLGKEGKVSGYEDDE